VTSDRVAAAVHLTRQGNSSAARVARIEAGLRVAGVRTERFDVGDRRPSRGRRLGLPRARHVDATPTTESRRANRRSANRGGAPHREPAQRRRPAHQRVPGRAVPATPGAPANARSRPTLPTATAGQRNGDTNRQALLTRCLGLRTCASNEAARWHSLPAAGQHADPFSPLGNVRCPSWHSSAESHRGTARGWAWSDRVQRAGVCGAVRCRARCAAVRQAPLQYLAGRPPREPSVVSGFPHR